MRNVITVILIVLALFVAGCPTYGAEQLFETARLEELQNNPEHARQLYREIIEDHPQSKFAAAAKKRLAALSQTE